MPQQRNSTGSAGVPAGPPLLASRLTAPARPQPMLWRPRLLGRLEPGPPAPSPWSGPPQAGARRRCSPPGRGRRSEDPPAWVQVEAGDSGERLWAYLVAALRGVVERPPDGPAALPPVVPLRPDQLEVLAAALAARERPVRLVVDDLHRVADPGRADRAGVPAAAHRGAAAPDSRRPDRPAAGPAPLRLAGELGQRSARRAGVHPDEVADLLVARGGRCRPRRSPRWRDRTGAGPPACASPRSPPGADPIRAVGGAGQGRPAGRGRIPAGRGAGAAGPRRPGNCCGAAPSAGGLRRPGRRVDRPADAGHCWPGWHMRRLLQRDGSDPPWFRSQPLLADLLHEELDELADGERTALRRRAADWYADHDRPAEALRHALAGAVDRQRAADRPLAEAGTVRAGPAGRTPTCAAARRGGAPGPGAGAGRRGRRAYAGDGEAAAAVRARSGGPRLPAPRRDRFRRLALAVELDLARLAGDHAEVRGAAGRLLATAEDRPGVPAGAGHPRDTAGPA